MHLFVPDFGHEARTASGRPINRPALKAMPEATPLPDAVRLRLRMRAARVGYGLLGRVLLTCSIARPSFRTSSLSLLPL